jgi:exonuclease SbcD
MKITHFTDTHYRLKSPRSRKDHYFETLTEKTEYIFNEESDSDLFIITGDIGDTSDWSEKLFENIADLFSSANAPVYVIAGNHDIHSKVSTSSLWLKNLSFVDNVNFLDNESEVIDDRVKLIAQPFNRGCDGNIDQFDQPDVDDDLLNIGLFHTFVLDEETPFFDHVLVDDVLQKTNLDIILNGHHHEELVRENNETVYINPGSLSRAICNEANKNRIPKYSVISTDSFSYETKEVEVAKPWDEVVEEFYQTNDETNVSSEKVKESVKHLKSQKDNDEENNIHQSYKDLCRDQDREDLIEDGLIYLEKAEKELQ